MEKIVIYRMFIILLYNGHINMDRVIKWRF